MNPEAIKLIAYRVKFLETADITKLYDQQSGEVAFILEAELRSRGILVTSNDMMSPYDKLFIDEAKLFDKFRGGRHCESGLINIPKISAEYAKKWIISTIKEVDRDTHSFKKIAGFLRKIMLLEENIICLMT